MDYGVVAQFTAQNFNGAVCNDLVGVHVGSSAGAALNGVADKLVVMLAFQDLVTDQRDGVFDLLVQLAHVIVTNGASLLDLCQGVDELGAQLLAGDLEVFTAAHRLDAVVDVHRDMFFADGVFFHTK